MIQRLINAYRVRKAIRALATDVARRKAAQSLPREDQRAIRRLAKTRVAV